MRIVVVEAQQPLRDKLLLLLGGEGGLDVVACYGNCEQALAEADWRRVDVLITDLDLPGASGVELIRAVKTRGLPTNCLVHTQREDAAALLSAIAAGACGYLLKDCSPRELVESVRELHSGGSPMSPKMARRLFLHLQAKALPQDQAGAAGLSKSELAVLRQIELGSSYKEVGKILGISPHTVHTHVKRIYGKLQAESRDQALFKARNLGLL